MIHELLELKIWKKKQVAAFSALFLGLLIFLIIKIVMPCKEYHYEGNYSFEKGIATENTVIYDGIHLTPGVWRVSLDFETDTDMVALCNVQDSTVFYGGLLSNGEHLYRGGASLIMCGCMKVQTIFK